MQKRFSYKFKASTQPLKKSPKKLINFNKNKKIIKWKLNSLRRKWMELEINWPKKDKKILV